MATVKLGQIDVNLLVALDVLLEERHVTRAAKRLAITQSAMSQTLQRLRDALGDPLLVRQGQQMALTPRAEALAGPLRAALRDLERALVEPPAFDPARSPRRFRVALHDVHAATVLPALAARVWAAARDGGVGIDVVPADVDALADGLRRGDIDLGLVIPRDVAADLQREVVLRERLVALVRPDHPLVGAEVPDFLAYPHAVFSITGRGGSAVEDALVGRARRVLVRLPFFLAAPALARVEGLVVLTPSSLAALVPPDAGVALPFPYGPGEYAMEMVWSRHMDADPGHAWLRDVFRAAAREVSGSPG